MSIATIRNDGLSRKQHENRTASLLSVVESTGRPPARFGVQRVSSDFQQPDEGATPHNHGEERLVSARQVPTVANRRKPGKAGGETAQLPDVRNLLNDYQAALRLGSEITPGRAGGFFV
jgi:hypothetical protein